MTDTSKYYLHTKEPLPMDIDFLVHDTYSMTRPQWKLASDLQEAARLFGEAVAQNYRLQDSERAAEPEDEDAESESSDEGLEEDAMPEVDEEQESSDEADVRTSLLFKTLFMPVLTRDRRLIQTENKTAPTIPRKKKIGYSSSARKRSVIRKQKLISTVNSRR